jgi:hypothetical protein
MLKDQHRIEAKGDETFMKANEEVVWTAVTGRGDWEQHFVLDLSTDLSILSPEDRNTYSFQSVVFFLEYKMMDKVQKPSKSKRR